MVLDHIDGAQLPAAGVAEALSRRSRLREWPTATRCNPRSEDRDDRRQQTPTSYSTSQSVRR